ncbi:MAG: DNA polymerase I [Candidatus Cloacimonetes bacterium]|nr:DNA polymerase I [Candidatus Cloacimonadota bacterium]
MKKSLYLIDGTALLYRSYYAFIRNPLINSKGQNTSAIFGVLNSFISMTKKLKPDCVMVSFDRKAPTFRHEKSELYKANRPPMPDDLVPQIEPVMQFFARIGLREISLDGYEADDILGTLAQRYKDQYEVYIVSGDKDFAQLVDSKTKLYDPIKDRFYDEQAITQKYGITPSQFIDYLALTGDSSDNIPGVKGIGPKGAVTLLNEYSSLDAIYANLDNIPEKLRSKLIADRENACLSRELATVVTDVPLQELDPADFVFHKKNLSAALGLLQEYELKSLLREVMAMKEYEPALQEDAAAIFQDDIFGREPAMAADAPQEVPHEDYRPFAARLADKNNISGLWQELKASTTISIDTETDSVEPMQASLVGISLCTSIDHAWYLPLGHKLMDNLELDDVFHQLRQALSGKTLLGHNLKYDLIVLQRAGLKLDNQLFDTMLAAYILEPGINRYSLDECAQRELKHTMIPITELIGSGKKQITFDLVDPQKACEYAAEDAWAVWKLYPIYRQRIEHSGMHKLFYDIEIPLLQVLKTLEMNGVAIDTESLASLGKKINLELKTLTDRIYALAGYTFNLNSPLQLAKLLFDEMKLPVQKKTKTGSSTDITVLEELSHDYEIADLLIQYRQLAKLESTYVSTLPKLLNPDTERIHSSFNQTITSTGRLSSSNPNLQNIPVRTELGREIRKAFTCHDPDWLYLSADYSQIELRLLALMSRDEVLLDAFRQDLDIHRRTASQIYHKNLEEISQEERRQAKVINFGILYGMGQNKLARELGISLAEAKAIIVRYFEQFPGINDFLKQCINLARKNRYCETLFGRRLYLPEINSSNNRLKSEAERIAVNMPIQGTAADLIKIAMCDIHQQCQPRDDIKMVLQVHDELVFEIKRSSLETATNIIRHSMENALPEDSRRFVHLKTDIGTGANWFEAH